MTLTEKQNIACQVRAKLVEISCQKKTPHLASALSCVDILVAAYWDFLNIDPSRHSDPQRDRFILSKGHAVLAQYIVLSMKGFISEVELSTFGKDGSALAEHPLPNKVPGVEIATGSLGHGLSVGLGMALAAKIKKQTYRTVVTLSDGECNEGSVWEAALMAPQHGLDNLVAIVDYNKWQATGRSNEVMALAPLVEKWRAFGWESIELDGHDFGALGEAFNRIPRKSGKPTAIVAHTVKGKGISFMEDDNDWHYRIATADDVLKTFKELGLERAES